MNAPKISVCIPTFRRPDRLKVLLDVLHKQTLLPTQVVVVDNDANRSAQPAVNAFFDDCPQQKPSFELIYELQPERNISLTRNLTVSLATGDWLAFIDDDELPTNDWLQELMSTVCQWDAQGALAPVLAVLPPDAPMWMRKGEFYGYPRLEDGTVVPMNMLRIGNAFLRGDDVRALRGPFDPDFRLSTGEDDDMLLRLIANGVRIVWSDKAYVFEPVEPSRLSLKWLMLRAYSGGQSHARKVLTGRFGGHSRFAFIWLLADSLIKLALALVLVPLSLPLGLHKAAYWVLRVQSNLGKLSAFLGQRYQAYRNA